MLRTKIREEIIASRAVAIAVEQAQASIYKKEEEKKSLVLSAKEHLGKMIDRVDPLELVAVLGMTVLIHDTYNWASAGLESLTFKSGTSLLGMTRKGGETELSKVGEFLDKVPDPLVWLISYTAAFIVIRHGAEIISAVGNVIKGLKKV